MYTCQTCSNKYFSYVHEGNNRILVTLFQYNDVEESYKRRRVNLDLLDEVRDHARINSKALKRRVKLKHKAKTKPRQFKVVDLVMRKAHPYQIKNKLSPK